LIRHYGCDDGGLVGATGMVVECVALAKQLAAAAEEEEEEVESLSPEEEEEETRGLDAETSRDQKGT
jgi:hypothetical protein